jgi:hypothetical protein
MIELDTSRMQVLSDATILTFEIATSKSWSYFWNPFLTESEYNEVYKKMKMMKRLLQQSFSSVPVGL